MGVPRTILQEGKDYLKGSVIEWVARGLWVMILATAGWIGGIANEWGGFGAFIAALLLLQFGAFSILVMAFIAHWLKGRWVAFSVVVVAVVVLALATASLVYRTKVKEWLARPSASTLTATRDSLRWYRDSTSDKNEQIIQLRKTVATLSMRNLPTPSEQRNPPTVSWPLRLQPGLGQGVRYEIASYGGSCDNLPPGQSCIKYRDGYVALVEDSLKGGYPTRGTSSGVEWSGRQAKYADYYHAIMSSTILVERTSDHPPRPTR